MDWTRIDATSDADIARQIADDPDTYPELDAEAMAAAETLRGPAAQAVRVPVSLRVSPEVLDWYRAQGPSHEAHMNAVLEAYMRRRERA